MSTKRGNAGMVIVVIIVLVLIALGIYYAMTSKTTSPAANDNATTTVETPVSGINADVLATGSPTTTP